MAFNKNSIILLDSICTFKASLQPVLSRNTQFVSCLSKFHRATAFLKPPVKALMLKMQRGTLTPATACASGSSSILGVKLYGKQPYDAECSSLCKMCRAPQYCIDDFLSSAAILKLGSSVQKHLGVKELNCFRRPAGISRTDSVLCRMAVGVPPRCITSAIYYFKVFPLCCLQSAGAPHR